MLHCVSAVLVLLLEIFYLRQKIRDICYLFMKKRDLLNIYKETCLFIKRGVAP